MKRILVIDDEITSIAVFDILLSKLNYEAYSLTNPEAAIETIRVVVPDLLLLDWKMPILNGIQVMKSIRLYQEFNHIPIIMVTGFRTQSEDLKHALDSGAMDFIRKPINEIELEARIASAFRMIDFQNKNIELAVALKDEQLENAIIKSQLLELDLQKKEREMSIVAVSIYQNKRFIASLKDDLLNVQKSFNKEQRQELMQLLRKYEHISNSLNWQLFEKRFIEVHVNFYNNLNSFNSELTWGELRLCALFRMGLTMKEITVINYSSYEATKKAVQRIRRKLNINEKDDIHMFLQKF